MSSQMFLLLLLRLVSVRSTSDVELYEEEGFFVLSSLLQREQALKIAADVHSHVALHGARYQNMLGGMTSGGWYLGDLGSIRDLSYIIRAVMERPKLHGVLTRLLGEDYRLLSRSEIYVDRVGYWHSDGLNGATSLYNNELSFLKRRCAASAKQEANKACVHGFGQSNIAWERDDQNESQRITTVAIYFQDHHHNDAGLSVIPRTHRSAAAFAQAAKRLPQGPRADRKADADREKRARLHYAAGDAIVFDARLWHRGQGRASGEHYVANVRHETGGPHRVALSLTFGANNAFSEAFDRGFAFRGRVHTFNSSICHSERRRSRLQDIDDSFDCRWEAVREDIRARPLVGHVPRHADEAEHTWHLEQLGRRLEAKRRGDGGATAAAPSTGALTTAGGHERRCRRPSRRRIMRRTGAPTSSWSARRGASGSSSCGRRRAAATATGSCTAPSETCQRPAARAACRERCCTSWTCAITRSCRRWRAGSRRGGCASTC